MANSEKQHVFFVDDEPDICQVVSTSLRQVGMKVTCFTSAANCLKRLRSQRCDLLIADVKMPEMSGLELLTQVKSIVPSLPVLIVTGYGDIPMAVRAMKTGALDFIEKPLERESFLSVVKLALKRHPKSHPLVGKVLTRTEIKVLRLILDGKGNKEIAYLLNRSVRTIEDHRRHIMRKLCVDNLVDLVKQTALVRLIELPEDE